MREPRKGGNPGEEETLEGNSRGGGNPGEEKIQERRDPREEGPTGGGTQRRSMKGSAPGKEELRGGTMDPGEEGPRKMYPYIDAM